MQISNNNSPAFGSIQVRLSAMNRKQRGLSNRLFDTIKFSDGYQKHAEADLDIYMLPAKSAEEIEIRYMDPYSGMFVRDDNNRILKEKLRSSINEKIEATTDKIIETYNKIAEGIIPRPKQNVSKVVNGETEMSHINPAKLDNLWDEAEDWQKLGYTDKEAENMAFEEFKNLYHCNNRDADF